MKKNISPAAGIIAIVIVLGVAMFFGYRMFLQPTPNEPVDASPYTKAFNEKMKAAFAHKANSGETPQNVPMAPNR
jgi:hypothetical protein